MAEPCQRDHLAATSRTTDQDSPAACEIAGDDLLFPGEQPPEIVRIGSVLHRVPVLVFDDLVVGIATEDPQPEPIEHTRTDIADESINSSTGEVEIHTQRGAIAGHR